MAAPNDGRVYLHPGQFAVASDPCTMTTILGSCVAVCLHDPVARVGGINHYLLSRAPRGEESLRFGNVAVPRLINELLRLGAELWRLRAQVVGGACVIGAFRERHSDLGRQNVRVALETLHGEGIDVIALEVGGGRGRRVVFHPHTGDMLVRLL